MPLTGPQHRQIQDALLAAFDEAGLRRLVRFELDEDLDQVTPPGDMTQRAYNLVAWADKQGCIPALIAGALKQNPGNADLQALAAAAASWHLEPAAEPEAKPPYQGLAYFDVADVDRFFGRERLTAELVACLKDHRFLAIVGASGSGKSSVVRAGVVTALKAGALPGSDRWATFIITPKARPLTTLAAALTQDSESVTATTTLIDDMSRDPRSLDLFAARLAARRNVPRIVLVVDQFEELFTLCSDQGERKAFVDNLLTAATTAGVTTVILTLRADFYAYCAQFDNLRLALAQHQNYIGAMSEAELRAAVEKPAAMGGWDFEPGLVDAILGDVAAEPGALPLLSEALLETWKNRRGRTLTFAGYHEAGGVRGAIGRKADGVYDNLPPEQQAIARNIFVRLTSLGEGTQDTRRRAPWAELVGSGERAEQAAAVLKVLEDARLVTAEREQAAAGEESTEAVYVDVTHEALIREWAKLDDWLHEDREGLRIHRRLTEAAQEWVQLQRDPGAMWRGVRLAQTGEWATAHDGDLNDQEREFLVASREQAEAEQRAQGRIQLEREEARQRELEQAQALAAEAERRRLAEEQRAQEAEARRQVELSRAEEQAAAQRRELAQAKALAAEERRARTRTRWLLAAATAALILSVVVGWFLYQQNQALEGERLLKEARTLKEGLDPAGAIAKFQAAVAADQTLDIDLSAEISDTLRYAATAWVQEGEALLRATSALTASQPLTLATGVIIQPDYLAWAEATAPRTAGWSLDAPLVQQRAVISATALFSQALALNPPSDTPVYVWIPPGEFAMGSTDEQMEYAVKLCRDAGFECSPDDFSDEQESHEISLDGYWIQRTEVTNEQYKRCYDAGGCPDKPVNSSWDKPRNAKLPVTNVSWYHASTYVEWVGGRLPTEAEWEKGCRGTDGRIFPWGDTSPSPELANYSPSVGDTIDVGTYPPGTNGIYDMAGNVWEWTSSQYQDYPYDAADGRENPEGAAARMLRGGSWNDLDLRVRCANRGDFNPGSGGSNFGFRVVTP
jgi:formylglycine-generating enzyme required for sulfatase activity